MLTPHPSNAPIQRLILTAAATFLLAMSVAASSGCSEESGPGTTTTDTLLPEFAVQPTPDASPQPDVPAVDAPGPDVTSDSAGETIEDTGPADSKGPDTDPDIGGCGPCPAGTFCQGDTCAPCNVDAHCTPNCVDCLGFGRVCAPDGNSCITCDAATPCGPGYECVAGECQACNLDTKCGADCQPCSGATPVCTGGQCVCDDTSCGAGSWCKNGVCETCQSDAHCGFNCTDCTATGTPVCNNGQCFCTADDQCNPGSWCNNGACEACANNDPLHCGPSCSVCAGAAPVCAGGQCGCAESSDCGSGFWCTSGACEACDTPSHCGPSCEVCGATTPQCGSTGCVCDATSCPAGQYCDGKACVGCGQTDPDHCGASCQTCTGTSTPVCVGGSCVCTADAHCGAGQWCDGGTCTSCTDNDPQHCGAACAFCSGASPSCVDGACACSAGSCQAGFWCGPSGTCESCDSPTHCGPSCIACSAPNNLCDGASCVQCIDDSDCGAGSWCNGGTCQVCSNSDPAHCGPSCSVCSGVTNGCVGGTCVCTSGSCPAGQVCQSNSCELCNDPTMCGPSCSACPGSAPLCASDGSGCIECFGDANCPLDEICNAGSCVPACAAEGCVTDVTVSGEDCNSSYVIGRTNAQDGFSWSSTTVGAGDDSDLSSSASACWDAKSDEAYRIYLFAGEQINISLSPMATNFDPMLKLFQGTGCGNGNLITCYNQGGDGDQENMSWQATQDGWVSIVVDGRHFTDPDGPYILHVNMDCSEDNCCCGG